MANEIVDTAPSGLPSKVRITSRLDVEGGKWFFDEPSRVTVAAGATIEWVFDGLGGNQPHIRFVGVEPPEAAFFDPIETLERIDKGIKVTLFREARGSYHYIVEVERDGKLTRLRCDPARMGGIDVSGPPVRGG